MKRIWKLFSSVLFACAVICGFAMTVHAQTGSCSVCGGAYENGFCKTENCAGAYEPATKTNIDGTDFYEIGNAGQLYWFAELVNGGKNLANAVLTADITVNENVLNSVSVNPNGAVTETGANHRAWTPIGSRNNYFRGVFDGKGHSISGLYFNDPEQSNVGLIGNAGHSAGICEIRNVSVKDSFIRGKSSVGAIVGFIEQATVKNCSQSGIVCGAVSTVGGIVGCGYEATLENCVNTGSVIGAGRRSEQIGGVAANLTYSEVKSCRNTGSVTGYSTVGGVIGFLHISSISDCENEGIVTGNASGNCVGGIVATVNYSGTIEACVNRGAVSGGITVGGIVGNHKDGVLTSCENAGSVSGTTSVGGLVGYNSAQNVTYSVKDCRNTGAVNGESAVGGLVGTNRSAEGVEQCFNTADVTGNSKVGGVVGENTGGVAYCGNTGNVTGSVKVGGIAGENTLSVQGCYNTGTVRGESIVGGVVGDNKSSVLNTYNTGAVIGNASVGGVMGTDMSWESMDNCYLKTDTFNASVGGIDGEDRKGKAQGLSAEAFACGEAAHLLTNMFGQTLTGENADALPVFRTDTNVVFRAYLICLNGKSVYSNNAEISEKNIAHLDIDGDGACDYCDLTSDGEDEKTENNGSDDNNGPTDNHGNETETHALALAIGITAGALAVVGVTAIVLFAAAAKKKKNQ